MKEQAVLVKEQAVLVKEQAVLGEEQAVLGEEQAVLAKEQAVLAKEQAVLAKEQAVPVEEQAVLVKEQAVLAKEQAVLDKDQAVLARERALRKEEVGESGLARAGLEKALAEARWEQEDLERTPVGSILVEVERGNLVLEQNREARGEKLEVRVCDWGHLIPWITPSTRQRARREFRESGITDGRAGGCPGFVGFARC